MQCPAKPQRDRIGGRVTRPVCEKLRQRSPAAQLIRQGFNDVGRKAGVELSAPFSLALEGVEQFR
jgi:hypothetical protein